MLFLQASVFLACRPLFVHHGKGLIQHPGNWVEEEPGVVFDLLDVLASRDAVPVDALVHCDHNGAAFVLAQGGAPTAVDTRGFLLSLVCFVRRGHLEALRDPCPGSLLSHLFCGHFERRAEGEVETEHHPRDDDPVNIVLFANPVLHWALLRSMHSPRVGPRPNWLARARARPKRLSGCSMTRMAVSPFW